MADPAGEVTLGMEEFKEHDPQRLLLQDKPAQTPAAVRYHPESFAVADCSDQVLGQLSAVHAGALDELKLLLRDSGFEEQVRAQHSHAVEWGSRDADTSNTGYDCLLLRFLRAREFNVEAALGMLTADIEWRRSEDVAQLRGQRPQQVLAMAKPQGMWPHQQAWFGGFDYQERPVIFSKWGTCQIWKASAMSPFDRIVRFHVWSQEQAVALCEANSRRTGFVVETFVSVIDLEGMRLGQVTSEFLKLVRESATIDQLHYPERLGEILIINTPAMFGYVWNIVRPWLPAETQRKVKILASPRHWRPILQSLLGAHQLLPQYGGTATGMPIAWLLDDTNVAEYWRKAHGEDPALAAASDVPAANASEEELLPRESDVTECDWQEVEYDRETLTSSVQSEDYFDCSLETSNCEQQLWVSRRINAFLQQRSLPTLRCALVLSNVVLIGVSVVAICFCAYILNSAVWTPDMLELIIWVFIAICGLATLVLCLGFTGMIACQAHNIVVLRVYSICLNLLALVLFVIGALCLNVAAGNDSMIEKAINKLSLSDSVVERIEELNLMVGGASIALCVCSLLASALARAVIFKLRETNAAANTDKQLLSSLWILNVVLLLFTMVGMGFGAYNAFVAINYSLAELVFTQYLLFASGAGTLVSSLFGLTLTHNPRLSAIKAGVALLAPLLVLLVSAAAVSFRSINSVERRVASEVDDMAVADVSVAIQKTLLIAGVIEVDCALFQMANLLTLLTLLQLRRARPELEREYQRDVPLSTTEKLIILWATWSGFVHIFFDGTYALLSQVVRRSSTWYTWMWRIWGQVDSRFTRADSLIVATTATKALVSGPLCLYYSWAVYTRRRDRFTVGTLVCCIQLYSVVLYFMTEAFSDFQSTFDRTKDHHAFLFACFIIVNLLRFVVPLPVLMHNSQRMIELADKMERQHLLAEDAETERGPLGADGDLGDVELGAMPAKHVAGGKEFDRQQHRGHSTDAELRRRSQSI